MAITPHYTDNGSVYIVNSQYSQKEFKGVVTELNIAVGERGLEIQHTFGDSYVQKNRPEMTEVSFTMVASGGDAPFWILGGSGALTAYPRSYTGDSTWPSVDIKYLQYDDNGTAQKLWIFSGARITNFEEANTIDEATTWDVTAKCRGADTTFKWTASAAASGLPAL